MFLQKHLGRCVARVLLLAVIQPADRHNAHNTGWHVEAEKIGEKTKTAIIKVGCDPFSQSICAFSMLLLPRLALRQSAAACSVCAHWAGRGGGE